MNKAKLFKLKCVAKSFMANERIKTKENLDIFDNSIRKAYFNFCRTMKYKDEKISENVKEECLCKTKKLIRAEVTDMLALNLNIQKYDEWHEKLCTSLEKTFTAYHIGFCVGKSQKWVNMTIKYLFALDDNDKFKMGNKLSNFHVPIDRIVINLAENKLGIKRPNTAWSKIEKYSTYLRYQNNVRDVLQAKDFVPLKWEFYAWHEQSNNSVTAGL